MSFKIGAYELQVEVNWTRNTDTRQKNVWKSLGSTPVLL
uniref:Uncharacterized protein n=1 Tax=Arundo donax TaxID=35708 RepID=A0A0A9AE71_ARUDO